MMVGFKLRHYIPLYLGVWTGRGTFASRATKRLLLCDGVVRVHANKFLNSTNVQGALFKFQYFIATVYRRTKNNIMFVIRYHVRT